MKLSILFECVWQRISLFFIQRIRIQGHNGNLSKAFEKTKTKFLVISFTSDWLYPTSENKEIVIALNAIGAEVGFVEIESDKGHDSFLLKVPKFLNTLGDYIKTAYSKN